MIVAGDASTVSSLRALRQAGASGVGCGGGRKAERGSDDAHWELRVAQQVTVRARAVKLCAGAFPWLFTTATSCAVALHGALPVMFSNLKPAATAPRAF